MSHVIDDRLLEPDGEMEIIEDFNRVLDIVDTLPSELPTVESTDAGKVLTVDSQGEWGADNPPDGLPDVTSTDEGKVLKVNSQGEWGADFSSELPSVSSGDEGKVLTVNSSGEWDAEYPSGGGGGDGSTVLLRAQGIHLEDASLEEVSVYSTNPETHESQIYTLYDIFRAVERYKKKVSILADDQDNYNLFLTFDIAYVEKTGGGDYLLRSSPIAYDGSILYLEASGTRNQTASFTGNILY